MRTPIRKKEFDVGYWENVWENVNLPQEKKAKDVHEFHHVFKKILPADNLKLIEIGCAPGSWLVYFHKCFHYSVSGIEYAPKAYETTAKNLKILNIPGEIFLADFFDFNHAPYDVVFSSGFIEHFEEVTPVIQKIVNLCSSNGGFVITIIPSMQGLNRWISKCFRPRVAAGHFPIKKKQLINHHECCGLKTRYCNYIGSFHFAIPIAKNKFSREHPSISAILNLPFYKWNRIISKLTEKIEMYPKFPFLTNGIIYIGEK